jgi:hypothetical protein
MTLPGPALHAACAVLLAMAAPQAPDRASGPRVAQAVPAARAAPAREAAGTIVVDDFEDVSGWSAQPSDGVELKIGHDDGFRGRALRLDFRFVRGGGYAVARKTFDVPLPADYRFRLAVRGATGPQNFEFKLIDSTGANVWWSNRRDFTFPLDWNVLATRKRRIEFAWGPAGGGTLDRIAAIEFAVTAGSGGQGTVWLDELTLEALPPPIVPPPVPVVVADSARPGGEGIYALDLGTDRELSGVILRWKAGPVPPWYTVELGADGRTYWEGQQVVGTNGGEDPIHLPDAEARFVRIRSVASWSGRLPLAGVEIMPPEWAPTINDFFARLAARAAPGLYPRSIAGEQPYWTAIGADGDHAEALVDEDGRVEPFKQGPSLEPFLRVGGRLRTWRDGTHVQRLRDGDLPMPEVVWTTPGLRLTTTAFVAGDSAAAMLRLRYRLENAGRARARGTFALAHRPFQVNPPPQFLNTTGGAARVMQLSYAGHLWADARPPLMFARRPDRSGVAAFHQGDVVADFLARGRTPGLEPVSDHFAHASALFEYDFDLAPGARLDVELAAPMRLVDPAAVDASTPFEAALAATEAAWRARRGEVAIELPPAGREALETFRAQLGWLRVTRDGAAVQPGARSYERSWIRDGALSSSAMLRVGEPELAREFAAWFAQFVPEDGAVPCCVDHRGPDPTPEHDSHGEFVFLVAEILRYTGDLDLARRLWPAVERAAGHIDDLRRTRQGPEWRVAGRAHFHGLLPPSISHEGYSAKPMHSYWDDFFALRGLTDAAWLAGRLGRDAAAARFAASRDSFAADFGASIRAAMVVHGIDYVPGCADLGDFDATSTTIALDPVQAGDVVPRAALERTFERYWEFFARRRDGTEAWDAYTPYELRTIGALVRLGQRERANEALDWFLRDRRPAGFRHWAEVVSREERKPRFLGDMPHTWVGTDYVRSFLDLFAYPLAEAGGDSSLVIAAGVREEWISGEGGVRVRNLPTPYGRLSYRLARVTGHLVELEIEAGSAVPPGGIRVLLPARARGEVATIDDVVQPGDVVVRRAPALVVFHAMRKDRFRD